MLELGLSLAIISGQCYEFRSKSLTFTVIFIFRTRTLGDLMDKAVDHTVNDKVFMEFGDEKKK